MFDETTLESQSPLGDLVPENPQDESTIAESRVAAAAAALEDVSEELFDFLKTGERRAPADLYAAVEQLVEICAEAPTIMWHCKSWKFLEHIAALAKAIYADASQWRDHDQQWWARVSVLVEKAVNELPNLRDMLPPQPRVVQLESIGELIEQGVSYPQICKIYEWTTPDGDMDMSKLRACINGDIEAPKTKEYPAFFGGPKRQPSLTDLDRCVEMFPQIDNEY